MFSMKLYESLKVRVLERRAEFNAFIDMLENDTSWLTSPAGTGCRLNEEGGLLKHSVYVAMALLRFRKEFAREVSEESCIITGLFHDVGKVGAPGSPLYIPNDNECEIKRGVRYRINPEVVPVGLALRSLYLVTSHITLSAAESQAIAYHDGQYMGGENVIIQKKEALTLLLHWADYWTTHIHEGFALRECEGLPVFRGMGKSMRGPVYPA